MARNVKEAKACKMKLSAKLRTKTTHPTHAPVKGEKASTLE